MKKIKIACKGADQLPLDSFEHFQGDLKSLSEDSFKKLKREILKRGFSFPIHIWKNGEKFSVIDGHQRLRCLGQMAKEGYEIPLIPVVYVHAKDEQEARMKVLSGASQYGRVERDGLYQFMEMSNVTIDEMALSFELPSVDPSLFKAEFYDETVAKGDPQTTASSAEDTSLPAPPPQDPSPEPESGEHSVGGGDVSSVEPHGGERSTHTSSPPDGKVDLTLRFLPEEKQEVMAFCDDLMGKWKLESHAEVILHAIIQAHKKNCRKK